MERKQLLVAMIALVVAASSSHASILTYDFTVTATSGSLAGVSSSGFFSFDESIIPSVIPSGGVAVNEVGLLTDLHFVWNGIAYDEMTANTGYFIFHPGGAFDACFGNNAYAGGCGVGSTNEWYVAPLSIGSGYFTYATAADNLSWDGTITYALVEPIPEPSILPLIGVAIAGLFFSRLRRQTPRPGVVAST